MKLIEQPVPFSPALREIRYTVALEKEEKGMEISIFNSSKTEKIGVKRATEIPRFTLNVADYVRSQIELMPLPTRESGIIHTPERVYNSCIAQNDWVCTVPHIAGRVAVGLNRVLSGISERTLRQDEQDEISWVSEAGTVSARLLFEGKGKTLEVYLGRREVQQAEMLTLVLNGNHLVQLLAQRERKWSEFSTATLEIHHQFRCRATLRYRLQGHLCGKTRVCWWNRFGGIDYYSFETTREVSVIASEKPAKAGAERGAWPGESRRKIIAATPYTTAKGAEELAGILTSPQVWLLRGEVFLPVEVEEKQIVIRNDRMTELTVTFIYQEDPHS